MSLRQLNHEVITPAWAKIYFSLTRLKKVSLNTFDEKFRKMKYNFKKGNYDGMRNFFGSINWTENFENKNVGVSYKIFLEIIEKACVQFIPKINPNNRRESSHLGYKQRIKRDDESEERFMVFLFKQW